MPTLTALKPLPYKGRRLSIGEDFECNSVQTARVLIALKKAKVAEDLEIMGFLDPEFEATTTTTEEPVVEVEEEPEDEKPKRKRTYKRKDMKAEDDQEVS